MSDVWTEVVLECAECGLPREAFTKWHPGDPRWQTPALTVVAYRPCPGCGDTAYFGALGDPDEDDPA